MISSCRSRRKSARRRTSTTRNSLRPRPRTYVSARTVRLRPLALRTTRRQRTSARLSVAVQQPAPRPGEKVRVVRGSSPQRDHDEFFFVNVDLVLDRPPLDLGGEWCKRQRPPHGARPGNAIDGVGCLVQLPTIAVSSF